MTLPNFFIIGAPSSGTTSLYYYIKQHPQVFMCSVKEPHFLSFGDKEFKLIASDEYEQRKYKIDTLEKYEALFQEVSDEIAIGEASTSYLWYSSSIPAQIKQLVPHAKIIALLRDPVSRAYSNYIRSLKVNIEPITNFAEALKQEPLRIENNSSPSCIYKSKGFYYEHLKHYFEVFDKDKIMICLYDDLKDKPERLMENIFRFLGVDSTFNPNISEKKNASFLPKNSLFKKFIDTPNPLKSILKPLIPENMRELAVTNLRRWNKIKPSLEPEIHKQLLQEYYEDILKLQSLIERDLTPWLKSD
ncbi:sulfotransferase family protein [Coleofasciculus sp. G2-EDA-02]|uniref:sulfotransferase family protein n=1 Tax=Coleofasciculus sp. G2-EDA-02 TaxID=3069529 RepID=UPI0033025327